MRRPEPCRERRRAVCCLLAALLVLLFPRGPRADFCLTVLDVGQGDAILISADGCNVLIDAGGLPNDAAAMAERVVLPYLRAQGIKRLTLIINTHPDLDHIGGLFAVVDAVPADELACFGGYAENAARERLLELAAQKRVRVRQVAAGDEFVFSDNFSIRVLAPQAGSKFAAGEENAGSLVLRITYRDLDVLTCGDLPAERLLAATADCDCREVELLQLPHHGSPNSFDEAWCAQFAPQAVFISVGRGNKFGHPGPQALEYWQDRTTPILRTDLHGSCRVIYHQGRVRYETAA